LTAPAPDIHKGVSDKEIAQFLCSIARSKPQDDNAALAYSMALKLDFFCAEAWNGLGRVEMGRTERGCGTYEQGIEYFTKAVKMNPHFAEARIHRGVANDRLGNADLALMDLRKAVALDPSITMADLLIFGILGNQERYGEAMEVLEAALLRRPDDTDLLFCRATLELEAGDFANGWKDYESRPTKVQLSRMLDEYAEWDGQASLEGKRIVVCREQGLGDEIMFARLVPELAKRGAHVIVYCYPPLARLFARIPGVAEIVTTDAHVPEFDYWVAMGSLPLKLGMALDPKPYIKIDIPEPKTAAFRVGLCWQGSKSHARDAYRSIPFAELKPLLDVQGVEFVSIQQNDEESGLERMGDRCHDLYDLACAMHGLDLVITVDTSVAHLAGALGIPAWVLLGKPADWRWNTPLYESVNLWCNEAPKAWASIIEFAADELGKMPKQKIGMPSCTAKTETIATADTEYGPLRYFTSDIWLGRSLAMLGEWSSGECDLYNRVIGPADVVVEVGANIGAHTVVLAKLAKQVIAFEPAVETCSLLKENTDSFDNVNVLPYAVGAESGVASLKTKPNNPGGTEVIADESGKIPVATIDECELPELSFLKADCEGSELAVLQGGVRTIARCRPLLYVENDRQDKSEALIIWIHEQGYRMYQHHTPLFNPDNYRGEKLNVFGNIVSAMLFCVPDERKDLHPTEWGMERVRVVRK
jgi:FkbM family methyltransferase